MYVAYISVPFFTPSEKYVSACGVREIQFVSKFSAAKAMPGTKEAFQSKFLLGLPATTFRGSPGSFKGQV